MLLGLALMVVVEPGFAFADVDRGARRRALLQGIGGAASWAGAMAWLTGAAPRERRGEMIGTAMGAAIAGALVGPVIGDAGRRRRHRRSCSAASAWSASLLAVWALRTPAAEPEGTSLAARARRPRCATARVAAGMWLIAVPGLLFGTIGVLAPLRLDDLGVGAAAIGAVWLAAALLEATVSPIVGRVSDRRGRLFPSLLGLSVGRRAHAALPAGRSSRGSWSLLVLLASAGARDAVGALDGACSPTARRPSASRRASRSR